MDWFSLTTTLISISTLIMTLMIYFRLDSLDLAIRLLKLLNRKMKGEECLKPKAALAVIQAAELLSLDAKLLYEKTKDEEFLKISKKWEEFVKANKEAIEKMIDKTLEN